MFAGSNGEEWKRMEEKSCVVIAGDNIIVALRESREQSNAFASRREKIDLALTNSK